MKKRPKPRKARIDSGKYGDPITIISDAAIASRGVGHGKMFPLLIIDTGDRPDVEELVRVHEHVNPGDVTSQWAEIPKEYPGQILLLSFARPVVCSLMLHFELPRLASVVDQIVRTQAVYVQPGRSGDRYVTTPTAARILVDIPSEGFLPFWELKYLRVMTAEARRRGLTRQQAKRAAKEVIRMLRDFGGFQMPS